MTQGHLEVLVEPFTENAPGAHVLAVIESFAAAGLGPDMGPFATTIDADLAAIIDRLGEAVTVGFDRGASAIQIRIERR
jgi:uncharacterized protein YqgV (UPF0045/DUF77 family)